MLSPLSAIDASVKAHEWSHLLTLGPYAAGPIQYDFLIDAEGNRYAVGGSVAVDLSPVPGDPEATARKARAVLQAAYAPGNPSGADMQVAQKAYLLLRQAEKELKTQDEIRHSAIRQNSSYQWIQPGDRRPESQTERQLDANPLHQPERRPWSNLRIENAPTTPEALDGIHSVSEGIQGYSDGIQGSSIQSSLYEKKNRPDWIFGYTPRGDKDLWYGFWFERETSHNRGALLSIWV